MTESFVAEGCPKTAASATENDQAQVPQMTATVPRQLVHRAAVAEVFLTGWSALDGERTRVLAQWPRAHSLYRPVEGRYDPMLAAETIRQAGVLVAHTVHGVPLGHRFLMWGLHFAVHPENLTVGSRPAELELDVAFTEIRGSGSRLGGRYTVTIRSAGHVVATGGAHFTCTSPAVYRRLREARLAQSTTAGVVAGADLPSVAPVSVGRDSARDVVLAPGGTPRRWQLRVDTSHPILFDHPDDHVPGMVLLEAARQAAATLSPPGAAPLLVSMDNTFDRYVEFDTPCWIEAEVPDGQPDHVRIVGRQDGEQVFSCLLSTSPSGA